MEGTAFWGTTNIKVASVVSAHGGKLRTQDPVTRFIRPDGTQQVTFWFESDGGECDQVRAEMERNWSEMKSDPESPTRYARASLS